MIKVCRVEREVSLIHMNQVIDKSSQLKQPSLPIAAVLQAEILVFWFQEISPALSPRRVGSGPLAAGNTVGIRCIVRQPQTPEQLGSYFVPS
jgi:hypothetical protein